MHAIDTRAPRRWSETPDAFLAQASKQLAASLDEDVTIRTIVDVGLPRLGDACLLVELTDAHTIERVTASHVDPAQRERFAVFEAEPQHTRWLAVLRVALAGRPAILAEPATTLFLATTNDHQSPVARPLALKSALLMPVVTRRTLAVAMFLSRRPRHYGHAHVLLAEDLASRFGLALDSAHAYTACQAAYREREEHVATVVHDVMSPLAYIKGNAQLLRRLDPWAGPTAAVQLRERLASIDAATARMAASLNGLFGVPEETQAERPMVELGDMTRRAIAEQQQATEDHVIRLIESEPPVLAGAWDGNQIDRLLTNLLSNAVKYSPAGSTVDVSLTRAVDLEGCWAVMRIRDHGIGIPAGDLPFVFEAFRRGGNVEGIPGTGLGLASAWQTVKTHAGRLWVESVPGAGTTVTVRLPLAPTDGGAVTVGGESEATECPATSIPDWPQS